MAWDGMPQVVRTFRIPYGAAMNTLGTVCYIDSTLPEKFWYRGRWLYPWIFLLTHEFREFIRITRHGLPYLVAHRETTKEDEHVEVLQHGFRPGDYERVLKPWLDACMRAAEAGEMRDIPLDIFREPYIQMGQEYLLDIGGAMSKAQAGGKDQGKPPKPGEPNAIVAGDEVYYRHHGGRIRDGKVSHSGKDGFVARCGAETHRVLHGDYVAHKKRADRAAKILEQGEDGALAEMDDGKAIFLHGYGVEPPPEEDEKPRAAKAFEPPAGAFLLFKGEPLKNRAGLSLQDVNTKTGGRTKRWKRTAEKPAAVRQPKEAAAPAAPSYPPKLTGEADKDYIKRTKADMPVPKSLPEEHGRYFNMEGGHRVVPLDKLDSSKTGEQNEKGGHNATKLMAAAYHGHVGKRDPISVHAMPNGRFKVVDGNGTLTGARKHGWKALPVKVVPHSEAQAAHAEEQATEAAKTVYDPKKFAELPLKGAQPVKTMDELGTKSAEALEQLKDWLNRGKGLASQMGYTTMDQSPSKIEPGEWDKHKGMLFIGKNKDLDARGAEKVEKEYGGDWSKLLDVVRCTLAVDNLHDAADAIKTLEQHGMQVMQQPKNKFTKPTEMGYRDVNFIVKMPNGIAAEIQFNVKDMLKAKNEAHHFYEKTRSIEGKYLANGIGKDMSKWDEADRKEFDLHEQKQQQTYGEAWKQHVLKHYGGERVMAKGGSMSLPDLFLWMEP